MSALMLPLFLPAFSPATAPMRQAPSLHAAVPAVGRVGVATMNGNEAFEVFEEFLSLLPIIIPVATVAVLANDGGGVVGGQWDGTAVRRPRGTRSREGGYYLPKSDAEIRGWLDANVGGGKTDYTYSDEQKKYSKSLFALPEIDVEELTSNPVVLIAAGLLIIEIALAKAAGVSSITGLLGFAAGQLAKGEMDAWNAVAPSIGLKGALLKY